MNRDILKYCPNYYEIVNFCFQDDDLISEKLINIYKNFIFSCDMSDKESLKNVQELDKVLISYIHDYDFRDELKKEIVTVKVKRDTNILKSLVLSILKIFDNYEEYTTRRLYISKWI